jgi:anti-anti-sigma regulatory factor
MSVQEDSVHPESPRDSLHPESAHRDFRRPVIRLEGTFDVPAARLLENSLRRLSGHDAVRVDFTRVRHFNDFAVAVLAQALKTVGGAEVKVLGLSLHQVRLLRYFGVDPEVFRDVPSRESAPPPRP